MNVLKELEKFNIKENVETAVYSTADVISTYIYRSDKNGEYSRFLEFCELIKPCEKSLMELASFILKNYECKPIPENMINRIANYFLTECYFDKTPALLDFYAFEIEGLYIYLDFEKNFYGINGNSDCNKTAHEIILYKGISEYDITNKTPAFLKYTAVKFFDKEKSY